MTCIVFCLPIVQDSPPIYYLKSGKSLYNFANARHGLYGSYSENGRSWESGAVSCSGSSYIQVHAVHLHKLQNNPTSQEECLTLVHKCTPINALLYFSHTCMASFYYHISASLGSFYLNM